jgi:hypothetical protein
MMRFNSLMFVSVATALFATPAVAQTAAPAAAPAATASATADPMDQVVCKRIEETGSLVKKKKKTCATRRQWEANAAKSREALDQGQMSGSSSGQ